MGEPLHGFKADPKWGTCPHGVHFIKGTKPKCEICAEQKKKFPKSDARSSPQKSKSWLCGMGMRPAKYP